jgi:3-oxoacyl-[acyl-carrier protein] reductase
MRSVIVTGGSRGIGLRIVRKLAGAGYKVIAISRTGNENLTAAIREAEDAQRGSLHFVPFDLGQIQQIAELVKQVRASFGPIYGLVNNAGISTEGVLALTPTDEIERIVQLNTVSPIVLTKYIVRTMMADGGGRIVNMSSITASNGYSGLSAYAATKASLIGFTKSLAREVGRAGVNVNAVAPGFVATDMTHGMSDEQHQQIVRRSALKRIVEADDIAGAVEFLLGEGSKNITGTVLTVDAGNTA